MNKRIDPDAPPPRAMELFQPEPGVLYSLDETAHLAGIPRPFHSDLLSRWPGTSCRSTTVWSDKIHRKGHLYPAESRVPANRSRPSI